MTKPFIYFVIGLASLSLVLSGALTITHGNGKSRLKKCRIESQQKIDSLKNIISEKDEEIDILQDQIQQREIEVMYWGMKYDSLRWKN